MFVYKMRYLHISTDYQSLQTETEINLTMIEAAHSGTTTRLNTVVNSLDVLFYNLKIQICQKWSVRNLENRTCKLVLWTPATLKHIYFLLGGLFQMSNWPVCLTEPSRQVPLETLWKMVGTLIKHLAGDWMNRLSNFNQSDLQ